MAPASALPTGPIDQEPIEVIRGKSGKHLGALLDDALRGIELGSYDHRTIEWLKTWGQGTVVTIASLITRARAAGSGGREPVRPRAEPLRMIADVEGALRELGIYELYEDDAEVLARRIEDARDGLIRTVATPAERARMTDIEDVLSAWGPVIQGDARRAQASYLRDEWASIVQSVTRRASEAGDPLQKILAAAEATERELYALWDQDQAAYRAAYEATVRQMLSDQGIASEVEFVDPSSVEADAIAAEPIWASLDEPIHTHVRAVVPLPMTGEAPDWTQGPPAEALRLAGRTYLDRATAS